MTVETVTVPQVPALCNLPNVELMHVGQWDLSTGRAYFTPDDLAAAIGALDCAAVRRPVLKLGHTDPRFDGEPAVGWVANLATAHGGQTLVGDYVGMPGWLGPILASAYPDRSIEGCWDFLCQIGHLHPFVITAVALLGIMAPGIGTLESLQDVATLYGVAASTTPSNGTPVAITVRAATSTDTPPAAPPRKDSPMPNPSPREVAAGVTTDDVRRAYYDDAPWSYWITSMELDPLQLIVMDDQTGKLYRIPVTIGDYAASTDSGFVFEPAIEVSVQYVDRPATPAPAAAGARAAAERLVYASRAESRPGQPPAAAATVAAGAIAVHHTGTTDKAWSAATNTKNLNNDDGADEYQQAYAWVDPDADPDTKSAYKFPHHMVGTDGKVGDANVKACQSAIGNLNGGMNSPDIPDNDKTAVYRHLAAHLTDAGLEAPELQAGAPTHPHPHTHPPAAPPAAAATTPAAEPTTTPTTEEDTVSTITSDVRSRLGLADSATDEEVLAALDTALTTAAEKPAAAALPEGVVTVDQATLDDLRAKAEQGVAARAQQRVERRDQVIASAINDGRIAPARREHWTTAYDADPDGTTTLLASLAPGLVPVEATGHATTEEGTPDGGLTADEERLFPTAKKG